MHRNSQTKTENKKESPTRFPYGQNLPNKKTYPNRVQTRPKACRVWTWTINGIEHTSQKPTRLVWTMASDIDRTAKVHSMTFAVSPKAVWRCANGIAKGQFGRWRNCAVTGTEESSPEFTFAQCHEIEETANGEIV